MSDTDGIVKKQMPGVKEMEYPAWNGSYEEITSDLIGKPVNWATWPNSKKTILVDIKAKGAKGYPLGGYIIHDGKSHRDIPVFKDEIKPFAKKVGSFKSQLTLKKNEQLSLL